MAGLVIEEPEEQTEDDRDKQQIWQIEAFGVTDAAVNEIVVGLLEAADRLCVGEDQGNAVDDGLRAERCDEGRHVEEGNDQAVQQTEHRADCQHDQQHHTHVHLGHIREESAGVVGSLQQNARKARGKANLTTGGQVGALGDQAAGDAECNQEADCSVAGEVAEVSPGEEVILREADNDADNNQKNDDRVRFYGFPKLLSRAQFDILHFFFLLSYENCVARLMTDSCVAS